MLFDWRVRRALYKCVKVMVSDGDTRLRWLQVLHRSQRALLRHKVDIELMLFAAPTTRGRLRGSLWNNKQKHGVSMSNTRTTLWTVAVSCDRMAYVRSQSKAGERIVQALEID